MDDVEYASTAANPFAVRRKPAAAAAKPAVVIPSLRQLSITFISELNPITTTILKPVSKKLALKDFDAILNSLKLNRTAKTRQYADFFLQQAPTNLISLNLSGCHLATQRSFAFIAGMPYLKKLDVSSTGMRDSDVSVLAASGSLQVLCVAENSSITDKCLPSFSRFNNLKELSIRGTSISMSGLRDNSSSLAKLECLVLSDSLMHHLTSRGSSTVQSIVSELKTNATVTELKNFARRLGLTGFTKQNKDELRSRIQTHLRLMEADERLSGIVKYTLQENISNAEVTSSSSVLDPAVAPDEASVEDEAAKSHADMQPLEDLPNDDMAAEATPATVPIAEAVETSHSSSAPALLQTQTVGPALMASSQQITQKNKPSPKKKPPAKKTGKRAATSSQDVDGQASSQPKVRKITEFFFRTPSSSSLESQPTQPSGPTSDT